MPYVITGGCCNDAACTTVCPVDCIHPTPGERGFATAEMLYIDPDTCIDCGACVPVCPVDAIKADDDLTGPNARFIEINAEYFAHPRPLDLLPIDPAPLLPADAGKLRVAIVGSGPAALYAAQELLNKSGVEVDVYERLPTPWGLVRAGVAPDHQMTKTVIESFRTMTSKPNFRMHLNVEIGRHLNHGDLLQHHHAVVYAHGASRERRLDIPGADLPNSLAATAFVGWYNGHPDHLDVQCNLEVDRAVIIGNGNVALDMARILVSKIDVLQTSDMADHAVDALRHSTVREVVVVGRRGPTQAAFTASELLALTHLPNVDVIVDPRDLEAENQANVVAESGVSASVSFKRRLLEELAGAIPVPGNKRILLRFLASPVAVQGEDHVTGVRLTRNTLAVDAAGAIRARSTGHDEDIEAGLLLHSVGYRGVAIDGVPFDDHRGVIPNDRGRVLDEAGHPLAGVYATGWIKRGPSGVIGTNKVCAQQTVTRIFEDFVAGQLSAPSAGADELDSLLRDRQPSSFGLEGWRAIDAEELKRGAARAKVRAKVVDVAEMLSIVDARR